MNTSVDDIPPRILNLDQLERTDFTLLHPRNNLQRGLADQQAVGHHHRQATPFARVENSLSRRGCMPQRFFDQNALEWQRQRRHCHRFMRRGIGAHTDHVGGRGGKEFLVTGVGLNAGKALFGPGTDDGVQIRHRDEVKARGGV